MKLNKEYQLHCFVT